ncbi:hypothetical protein OG21DRAFT_1479733 [Imleria badia]|nr:hypothetical protein OG21DRAFT_1479733 [Imleria badia]
MPSHTCNYCRRAFPTTGSVRRHISHPRACHEQWEIEAQQAQPVAGTPDRELEREHINEDIDLPLGVDDIDHHDWHNVDMLGGAPDCQDHHDKEDELEEEHSSHFPCFAQEFLEKPAADVIGCEQTPFERMKSYQEATGGGSYAPFADCEEWALAQWLVKNVNQCATEEFLKLPITKNRTRPSYRSNYTFLKLVDKLPTGPEWSCRLVRVHGDLGLLDENNTMENVDGETKELEFWMRDPVACVQELMSNPAFDGSMAYAPEKMWTADWWWDMQTRLPDGATVMPVILASNKTELSCFKGDKTAWPVYLTIGNISKEICREPSRHASVLLGYLPVSKLASFEDNLVAGYRLFHYCMKSILQPLVAAGQQGVEMVCADGCICRVFLILAAFIGDHPEQCLCLVPANQQGANVQFPRRNQTQTTQTLHTQATEQYPPEFIAEGLCPVFSPFWAELPHTDIFLCITSDILHQLHQGIIKDHLKRWCSTLTETGDFDARFRTMPVFPGLRHFKKGISTVKQWTATNHKQLERVFIGTLVGTGAEPCVMQAACSLIDFVYLTQYQSHTDHTLTALQEALDDFHRLKDIFIELGCWTHFNFPKLHSLVHYADTIRTLGSLDGLNTEISERLHIDFAKKAYIATSQKDYTVQMTKWLQRQEAVAWFSSYQAWRQSRTGPLDAESSLSISRRPQSPRKTVQYLEQHHRAVCFLEALRAFVNTLPCGRQFFEPNANDRFDIFTNVVLITSPMEHMAATNANSRIRSHPQRSNGVRKPPTLARHDTILVDIDTKLQQQRGGLHSLRVAEVRAIFRLPSHLGDYPDPLVYIHWFKPIQSLNNNTKMFRVSCSTRQWLPNTEVIPIH